MSALTDDNPRGRVFGRSLPRLEDPPLVTGRGRFVGDIAFPRQVHMRVVRSPYAPSPPGSFAAGLSTEATVLRADYGAVDAAFAAAHAVIELDLDIGRHSGVPLETRGALAHWDRAHDIVELYGAAKVPHRNRDA